MDLKEFAVYMGVPQECFEGMDLSALPAYDEKLPDCANLVRVFRWVRAQSIACPSDDSNELVFECAFQTVGAYEEAQYEEVDFATLEYFEANDVEAKTLGSAYCIVAEAYLTGATYIAQNRDKAIGLYRQAAAFGCELPMQIKQLL